MHKEKQKMKKLSESRLRQIIKEELENEIGAVENAENAEKTKENLNKIFSVLSRHEKESEVPLNELWGGLATAAAGALGANYLDNDNEFNFDDARDYVSDVLSGEEDLEVSNSVVDYFKRLLITTLFEKAGISGELGKAIGASLSRRSLSELVEAVLNPRCDTIVEFIWEGLVVYAVIQLEEPLSELSHSIGRKLPFVRQVFDVSHNADFISTILGGVSTQVLADQLLKNPQVVGFLDENVKPVICDYIDSMLDDIDFGDITSGILRFIT